MEKPCLAWSWCCSLLNVAMRHPVDFFLFFGGTGGLVCARQALLMLEPLHQSFFFFFVMGFFEVGSCNLFAQGWL
jgi:hypothetical protein